MAPKKKGKKKSAPKTTDPKPVAPRFAAWIEKVGPTKVAGLLGVTRFNVYGWLRYANGEDGGYRPDPSRLASIIRESEGTLTAADIYPEQV
jgi:hypothetical protein